MGVASGMLQLGRVAAVLVGGALAGFGWYHIYWCLRWCWRRCWQRPLAAPCARNAGGDQTGPEADRWDKPATAGLCRRGVLLCGALLYHLDPLVALHRGKQPGTAAMTGALTALGSVLSGLWRRLTAGCAGLPARIPLRWRCCCWGRAMCWRRCASRFGARWCAFAVHPWEWRCSAPA